MYIFRAEKCTETRLQTAYLTDVFTLFSMLCMFCRRPFTGSCEEGEKLNDLKSGTSIVRISRDCAASTAVKGLKEPSSAKRFLPNEWNSCLVTGC